MEVQENISICANGGLQEYKYLGPNGGFIHMGDSIKEANDVLARYGEICCNHIRK